MLIEICVIKSLVWFNHFQTHPQIVRLGEKSLDWMLVRPQGLVTLEVTGNQRSSFNRSFVFCLAGHLPTAILAGRIAVLYLRISLGTQCQQGQKRYPV